MKQKLLVVLVASAVNVYAEPALKTNEIIVNNYRYDNATELTAPYSIEIHTDKEIAKSGSTSLFDYLSKHTGLSISPSYGDKNKPLIDMRGYGIESGYQNLVISVDGVKLNNIDMVTPFIGAYNLSSIERIEINRGSGSVVRGDGAMAGSIQIYTKNYEGVSIESAIGSAGLINHQINAGLTTDLYNLSVNISDEKNDGYSDADTQGNKDKSVSNTGQLKLTVKAAENLALKFGVLNVRTSNFIVGNLSMAEFLDNPKQNSGNQYGNFDFDYDKFNTGFDYNINSKFTLNGNYAFEDKETHSITSYNDDTLDYETHTLDLVLNHKFGDFFNTYGLYVFDGERLDGGSSRGKVTKDNKAVFANSEYQLNNTLFSAGYRQEKVDYSYNAATSAGLSTDESLHAWNIGLNHSLNSQLSIFTNLNRAFQAPDVDRFFIGIYPAPNYNLTGRNFNGFIDPASSETLNVGLNYLTSRNKFKIVAYYSDVKNEIAYVDSKNQNIDNSKKYGVEIQNNFQLNDKTNVGIAYNYVEAKIGSNAQGLVDGNDMPGVPKHTTVLDINYKYLDQGNINFNHTWKQKTYHFGDFANSSSQKQPAYSATNLSINYVVDNVKYADKINLFGSVNNIFEHANAIQSADDSLYPFNFSRTWMAGVNIDF
jgi:iron complex outermembrane recepter protein